MNSGYLPPLCIALCILAVSSEISQLRLVSQSRCGNPQNYSVLFPQRVRSASFYLERLAADGLDGSMCFLVELPPVNVSADAHLGNLCLFQELFIPHPFVRRLECTRPTTNASGHLSAVGDCSHCGLCSVISSTQDDVSLRTQLLKSGQTILCDSLTEGSHDNLSLRFCIPSENFFWHRLAALKGSTERWTNDNPWECDPHRINVALRFYFYDSSRLKESDFLPHPSPSPLRHLGCYELKFSFKMGSQWYRRSELPADCERLSELVDPLDKDFLKT